MPQLTSGEGRLCTDQPSLQLFQGDDACDAPPSSSEGQIAARRRRYEDADDNDHGGMPSPTPPGAATGPIDVHARHSGAHAAAAATGSAAEAVSDMFPPDLRDEYDPLRPNDYVDDVVAVRRARAERDARDAELRRVMEEEDAQRRQHREDATLAAPGSAAPATAAVMTRGGRGRGVDIMPAWMKQAAAATAAGSGGDASSPGGSVPGASSLLLPRAAAGVGIPAVPDLSPSLTATGDAGAGGGGKPLSLGAKLLAKWGYEQGKGLGKDGSGLTAPLIHEKTGVRSGVIRVADAATASVAPAGGSGKRGGEAGVPRPDGTVTMGGHTYLSTVGVQSPVAVPAPPQPAPPPPEPGPSRVVCLRNMAGPGEVDDELEAEVRGECEAKYGPVDAVFVFQCGAALRVPPEEAVRIVVAFVAPDGAARARGDLHGRFFGGRAVRAAFFPEERFARFDFAPTAAELAAMGVR